MIYQKYTIDDVKKSSDRNLFSVISTFAGGGGSSTGYRLAGGNVLAINEFVAEAVATYSSNYPETKVIKSDIKTISGYDLLSEVGLKQGELDILDGSPPCSAFSAAGKRDKGWNQTKSYSTGQTQTNIEDLFLEFIRVANDIQPKVIIAENVKGITEGKALEKLYQFLNEFEKIGYMPTYKVLDAADYGTPQNRNRTIIICVRNDVADAIGLYPFTMQSLYPVENYNHVSIAEGIDDVENDPAEIQKLLDNVQNTYHKKVVSFLPANPQRVLKPEVCDANPKGHFFTMKRPAAHLPSPTVTAEGSKLKTCGVLHYSEDRKLTIKELKRVMGLPEDYILTGNFDRQAERIGRMVAPKMMAAVASSVYEKVIKPYNELKNEI